MLNIGATMGACDNCWFYGPDTHAHMILQDYHQEADTKLKVETGEVIDCGQERALASLQGDQMLSLPLLGRTASGGVCRATRKR